MQAHMDQGSKIWMFHPCALLGSMSKHSEWEGTCGARGLYIACVFRSIWQLWRTHLSTQLQVGSALPLLICLCLQGLCFGPQLLHLNVSSDDKCLQLRVHRYCLSFGTCQPGCSRRCPARSYKYSAFYFIASMPLFQCCLRLSAFCWIYNVTH